MEEVRSPETSINSCRATLCHLAEDSALRYIAMRTKDANRIIFFGHLIEHFPEKKAEYMEVHLPSSCS
jgi:hypothetical protein